MSEKPLVSFLVITYNQERFVREAVQASLSQTYVPLEIIFSDDCSSDKTYDLIVAEASSYRGPHRIILNRNQSNLGLAGNFNRGWELSSGKYVVLQAGDDISSPDRTEKLVERLQESSSPVDLACSYFAEITEEGTLTGFIKEDVSFIPDVTKKWCEWRCGATGACASYSRKLYEKYGPINEKVLSEDWVYSFRAWLESGIAVIEEPLVKHRTHNGSIAVMQRDIKLEADSVVRRARRLQGEENRLAIANEWLRAFKIAKTEKYGALENKLRKLVRLRKMQVKVYSVDRVGAFKLACSFLAAGGNYAEALRMILRHVIRWD